METEDKEIFNKRLKCYRDNANPTTPGWVYCKSCLRVDQCAGVETNDEIVKKLIKEMIG